MFNTESGLVKIWVRLVKDGLYTYQQVPVLSNLKDIVGQILFVE